jgi:hypothetical protein
MGNIIESRFFSFEKKAALLKPIIFCNQSKEIDDTAFSINILLAEKLIKIKSNRRTIRIEKCLRDVLDSLPAEVTIKDFDVLFNPDYQIDILKIMVTVCKMKPFNILWPGKYENGALVYAQEGFQDFKVFNIEDYDVTCII